MKVTKCDDCGYEITMKTDTCPSCGERIGIKVGGMGGFLRRIIFFLMALYIIYSAIKFFIET
jgi:DNA-directed RNA polymerase subunit RPC12/RpoP